MDTKIIQRLISRMVNNRPEIGPVVVKLGHKDRSEATFVEEEPFFFNTHPFNTSLLQHVFDELIEGVHGGRTTNFTYNVYSEEKSRVK